MCTFFSKFRNVVCTYKQYQPILFFYCYQFYHAALGDRALLVKGIIDIKTIFSVTPLWKCILPCPDLHTKNFCEFFIEFIFFSKDAKEKVIFKARSKFPFQLASLAIFN